MTPEQLDEIEQRANRATQAPWETSEAVDETEYGSYTAYGVEPIAPLEWYYDSDTAHTALEVMTKEDAEFISAARTDVPQLVAEVRKLQERVEHYRNLWQGTIKDSQEVLDRNHDLEAQIEAVEKLHRPSTEKVDGAGVTYRMCLHCTYINRYGQQRYPCPTIHALGES